MSFSNPLALSAGCVSLTAIGTLCIWKIWNHKKRPRSTDDEMKILFFPDSEIACKKHFSNRHGCTALHCRYSHDKNLSYAQLMTVLSSARESVDLCVFCLTCKDLCEIIVQLHNKGVTVRIITDSDQSTTVGSQLGFLRAEGIQVRCDNTSFFMHHKFLITDGTLLINGSFNWTRQAITGNFENLLISSNRTVLNAYIREFNRLWNLFDPTMNLKTR